MRLLELRADAQKFAQALEVTESALQSGEKTVKQMDLMWQLPRAFGSHGLTIPKQIWLRVEALKSGCLGFQLDAALINCMIVGKWLLSYIWFLHL